MSTDFVEELPKNGRQKYDWPTIGQTLRDNPGQWATIGGDRVVTTPSAAQMTAAHVRDGRRPNMGPGPFESTTRGSVIYVRYVGEQ
jgi:hypothetical protein